MKYEDIIQTISEIINNNNIYKEGLTLVYELDKRRHKQVDEELYIRINGNSKGFEHQDIVEMEMGGVKIKFVEKGK